MCGYPFLVTLLRGGLRCPRRRSREPFVLFLAVLVYPTEPNGIGRYGLRLCAAIANLFVDLFFALWAIVCFRYNCRHSLFLGAVTLLFLDFLFPLFQQGYKLYPNLHLLRDRALIFNR